MLKNISVFLSIVLVLFSFNGFSQKGKDTLLLLNGSIIIGTVIDTTNGVTNLKNPKDSLKNLIVENDRIFSISNSKGESIIYVYDTIIGNEFTIEEMRYFIKGEQDAENGFKAKGAFWANVVLGAAGAVTGSFLCPIPPFAFTALTGLPKVNINHNTVSNIDFLKHDTYIMGYERVARKKRKISSLIGGGAGIGVGLGTYFILKATDNEIK
ncbi:MAG: hypothetical protein NTX97_10910, partial [Bacteroidetes bacterium]|nr:hypothetical protein [Bacteroidota bacterium]